MSDDDLIKHLRRRHEDVCGPLGERWWKLVRDAYQGSGGFRAAAEAAHVDESGTDDWITRQLDVIPGSYLRRFGRENANSFAQRQRVSHYRNHVRTIVAQYQGHLWRRPPQRESAIATVSSWWASVDGAGTTIAAWLARGSRRSQLFGWAAAYFDRPREPQSLASAATTARWLQPEEVSDWQIGADGALDWIKLCTEVETRDPLSGVETELEVYTIWTRSDWRSITLLEADNKLTILDDTGPVPHTLGAVPVAMLYWHPPEDPEDLYGTSHLDGAVAASLELFNVSSEARAVERGSAFPILYVQTSKQGTLASLKLGVNNGLELTPDVTMAPGFCTPDASISEHYAARRAELRDEIYQSANLDPPTAQTAPPESGVARAYRFLPRRSVLVDACDQLVAFERRCVEILARWDGATTPSAIAQWQSATRVQYPSDFDVSDTSTALDQGGAVLDRSAALPPVTVKAARLSIGRAMAPQATPADEAALTSEVEQLYQRDLKTLTAPSKAPTPDPAAPGNPDPAASGANGGGNGPAAGA